MPIRSGQRPAAPSEETRFDARLIRWLLGGEIGGVICRAEGIALAGLWVEGQLDLTAMRCDRSVLIADCHVAQMPQLRDAELRGLNLSRSSLPGLKAQGLRCSGRLIARNIVALGCFDLTSARITGQLSCSAGRFDPAEGPALNCNGAEIGAGVFLDNGFVARGEVNFVTARITGHLSCRAGRFEAAEGRALTCNGAEIGAGVFLDDGFVARGEVDFVRSKISGDLACRAAEIEAAFQCRGMQVDGTLFFQEMLAAVSSWNLSDARVGVLADDAGSWEQVTLPDLSGFTYGSIQSDMTVAARLALLGRKWEREITPALPGAAPVPDFDPQPYSQLAQVYERAGHRRHAAKVRLIRERRLARAARRRKGAELDGSVRGGLVSLMADLHDLRALIYGVTFGYGHAPFRALLWSLAIIGATWWGADYTYARGEFAPASNVVLVSADWQDALRAGCPGAQEAGCAMPLKLWEASPTAQDYETFSAPLYALDLFLPLDALGQEAAWAPSPTRGWAGAGVFYVRWFVQLAGWFLIATAAAVLTGVIGKKD